MNLRSIFCCCFFIFHMIDGYKILILYPAPSFSRQRAIMALTEKLAERGHELFVVSTNAVPGLEQNPNYTFVDVSFLYKYYSDEKKDDVVYLQEEKSKWKLMDLFKPLAIISREQFLSEAFIKFQRRVQSEKISFDVVIVDVTCVAYACPVVRSLTGYAPIISMSTYSMDSYTEGSLGSIPHLSFTPSLVNDYTNKMNLWQRLENWFSETYLTKVFIDTVKNVAREFSRDTYGPEYEDLVDGCWKNLSLHLSTSNSMYYYPRLLGPNVIEVGPLHLKTPQRLPKDLQDWLDGAEKGVIYFSLGSNIKSKSLPEIARANLLRFFKELPSGYRVLWKDEPEGTPNLANNILTRKWLPQESVLAHPKVRVFITQGGLQSFQEAVHFGVPVVGIPWYGDQRFQVWRMVDAKIGARLLPKELHSFDKVKSVIESVLYEKSILENMRRHSAISRDFSAVALDRATFWVEHVARHGGADHLRPFTAETTLFQYFALDIVAVCLVFTSTILFVLFSVCKFLIRSSSITKSVKIKAS
nr:PREDICTED: UDP-glucuronosyltransferase 2B7-like [Bemisia tabaci]XP_018896828.1 PREDICTED: UDP-glucuronosyltransferase 2B7-like [Bemisia tabaci]